MKRSSLILAFLLFSAIGASAQILKPVSWSYAAKKISKTEAIVYIKAKIDDKWHIYSQNLKPGGPNPTLFSFNKDKAYTLNGKTLEPKAITYYDKSFKMDVGYFEKQVVFQQKVKLNASAVVVKGKIEFVACDDTQCLPTEEVSFSIPVK